MISAVCLGFRGDGFSLRDRGGYVRYSRLQIGWRGGGLGASTIFKKFHKTYDPS